MKRFLWCWLLVGTMMSVHAQVVDRIVAIVDKEIILESELNAQIQFFVFNNKLDPNTPGLREQVLQSMIGEKLIIAKAIEDSVTVTDEEVAQQLDAAIQQRVQQVGSEARLEELYGMPLPRIRREFREEMRKNMLSQRLQQQRFGTTQVSRFEVEQFYQTYKDSLPPVPEEVDLAHIFIKPRFSAGERDETRARMLGFLDSLKAGADFADLASRYSEDPGSAKQGGNLGLVRRGQLVKEFETAAFSLNEGEVSGIVETDFGYHLIQLLERRGDAIRARHILLRIQRSGASDTLTVALLDSIRSLALGGKSFAELAKQFSEDKETNLVGGALGTLNFEQLGKDWLPTVSPLKAGEISAPAKLPWGSSYGYHIVQVRSRTPAHPMTLEQDYHKVEALAMNYKRTREYQHWLEDLRTQFYWKTYL
jgi:peptidyl-prolyl cis-trans isomerase SurA